MSFIDSLCVFMDDDALTDAQAAHLADKFLDVEASGAIDNILGDVYWNTMIGTVGTDGAGMYLKLITSDSATFASGNVIVASIGDPTDCFGFADWPAGKSWSIKIPTKTLKKYLGVEFVETTDAVALKVDSWLGMEPISELNIQKEPT